MTNISARRDRSVVTLSVIPSAKYCWLGSLLRLAKGSTTIDKRGAPRGCGAGAKAAAAGTLESRALGRQSHQALMPSKSTAPTTAAVRAITDRPRSGGATGTLDTAGSPIATCGVETEINAASVSGRVTGPTRR